ncbi:hypothetical protein ACFPC0_06065 [Streptomyces andamanensis]|uniref:Uncharacterized protein n=1 Tax=Streptomyces andamanensis TaxID=1565035 RepID=A0ABV8TA03_9ACTN
MTEQSTDQNARSTPAPAATTEPATTEPAETVTGPEAVSGTVSGTEAGSAPEIAPAPAGPPPPVRKDRRRLRALLRWTAAVAVFAAAGAGTAYGVTRMDRTDVPGLATASDGRWDYPSVVKPPLLPGRPAVDDADNTTGAHYTDLRALVLPAPHGAHEDTALRGTGGWLATKDFLTAYARPQDREKFGQQLTDHGLRHVAARGWTTADGTRTRIYLLQFDTAPVVQHLYDDGLSQSGGPGYELAGVERSVFDNGFPAGARVDGVERVAYAEAKPYGAEQTRQAYLRAGDVLALVVQSRKGSAATVPFQQTVTLQSELLG